LGTIPIPRNLRIHHNPLEQPGGLEDDSPGIHPKRSHPETGARTCLNQTIHVQKSIAHLREYQDAGVRVGALCNPALCGTRRTDCPPSAVLLRKTDSVWSASVIMVSNTTEHQWAQTNTAASSEPVLKLRNDGKEIIARTGIENPLSILSGKNE
jgi:hypothetical protein